MAILNSAGKPLLCNADKGVVSSLLFFHREEARGDEGNERVRKCAHE